MKIVRLYRDYETRSRVDLKKVGAHVYASHPSTEMLCAVWIAVREDGSEIAYAVDKESGCGIHMPAPVGDAIRAGVPVVGHNAAFEDAMDTYYTHGLEARWMVPEDGQLDCTLARAAAQALPLGLGECCAALGVDYQKDKDGHRLMLKMCKPVKKTGVFPYSPDMLARLVEYCYADVRAEMALDRVLAPLSETERKVWTLDQEINNRGIMIDRSFVHKALQVAERAADELNCRMADVTAGAVKKCSEAAKLKDWAKAQGVVFPIVTKRPGTEDEYEAEQADKPALETLLDGPLPPAVRLAFKLRLAAAKSSVRKLEKFSGMSSVDGRARGNLQYHAASTGRWGGRGIQLQNLPRSAFDADAWEHTADAIQYYPADEVLDVVSKLLRGALVASPGHKLVWGDYSQVEARGVVWAAGQKDVLDLFASGADVYVSTAATIFRRPVAAIDKTQRFFGKTAVLGCGFGVGAKKFQAACERQGVECNKALANQVVYGWREKNGRVVMFWREIEQAAFAAIHNPGTVHKAGPFSFRTFRGWMQMRLPSGRVLWYSKPHINDDLKIAYWAVNTYTKKWSPETTWGGKLLENAIQGMCRDFLAAAILRLSQVQANVVLTVHDELILESPTGGIGAEWLQDAMSQVPSWANGFPLKAETDEGRRYGK